MTRRYSAGVVSITGENTDAIALLIHTSMGPNVASTAAAAASTASASATSQGRTSPSPPAASTSRFAPSSPSRPRARSPIRAFFRFARAWTIARPTPADAPVTTTTGPRLMPGR